jgi:cytoskeletal protein CcmA (bactofilin family)
MAEKKAGGELSLISPGTVIEGKLKTEGNIRIDGKLIGDLAARANAAVGLTGSVEGTLQAKNISLAGKVHGTVTAEEKLILESKAVVRGDIRAARLVVDEGAIFDGECAMTGLPGAGRAAGQRD